MSPKGELMGMIWDSFGRDFLVLRAEGPCCRPTDSIDALKLNIMLPNRTSAVDTKL